MTRRKWFGFVGAAAASAVYPCWAEPRWFEVTRKRAPMRRAPLARPIRVLHLSDLHASMFVPLSMIDAAIAMGLAAKPDVICLTGDFISHSHDNPAKSDYARVLRRLSAAAPAFAVMGNHDGGRWAARIGGHHDHRMMDGILEESGIQLLHNRSAVVEVRGQTLAIAGVGDLWSDEVDGGSAFRGVDERLPAVLLAHNPDTKDALGHYRWDLMLSGHTHGGQVIVPFYGTPFVAVADARYLSGLKPWGERQVHVTRGVGNLLGVRFNCRPEVSVLEVG